MKSKVLKSICLLALMISAFSFVASPKDELVKSVWSASPPAIDGSNADWPAETMNTMKKFGIDYAFTNDGRYLYVLFIFKDRKFMSTVQLTGLTLWLNTEGTDKKTYGINFKERQVSADELIAILERQQGPIPDAQKARLKSTPFYKFTQGEVIDKKGNNLTPKALGSELEAPVFKQKGDRAGMSYEFRLPLNILEKLAAELKLEPGKIVKIGFEWGGMTKELLQARTGDLGAEGTRASEGRAEFVTDEERDERTGGRSSELSSVRRGMEKRSFWVDVQLAQGQQ